MRPAPGEVLHFSEDPTIDHFVPHLAATAAETEPYVWAVEAARSPDYWFPRDCPRAMAWVESTTTDADRERIIGAGCGDRVHAIEYRWLDALRTTRLYAYRLPAARSARSATRTRTRSSPPSRSLRSSPPSRSATCWPCTRRPESNFASCTICGRCGTPCCKAPSPSVGYDSEMPCDVRNPRLAWSHT